MKKLILSAIILIGFTFSAQAQNISKNALGVRFGGNNGFGGEISYQRGLSKSNRLEVDLGWRNNDNVDALKLTGIYQWVWNIEGGFNWYAGVGGGLGTWNHDNYYDDDKHNYDNDNGTFVFAVGDIGIEYNFHEAPISISLDARPEIGFGDYNDGLNFDVALGIRYRF
jgi:hypothetical protein